MDKKEINKHILVGDLDGKMTTDYINGELLDTKVEISGGVLCCISGESREEFLKEINEVINKYRI